MSDPNRKITITDTGKPGGVKLENAFGEKSNQVFDEPINNIKVTYETVKPI